jgi:hypothetical protein
MFKGFTYQGRIQDFKLGGGGALKKIAPSRGRRENFWGISCEKSRFYTKKILFFPILGGRAPDAPPAGSTPAYICIPFQFISFEIDIRQCREMLK